MDDLRPLSKYPRTPYWSDTNPSRFVGVSTVITEKLDGSNVTLYDGDVYGRSVSAPSTAKWMAMVKKHHAWKTGGNTGVQFYGEDIYGVHSIAYAPVLEDRTFYLFAAVKVRVSSRVPYFLSWDDTEWLSGYYGFPVVPIIYRGVFASEDTLQACIQREMQQPSVLGGEREGLVIRRSRSFDVRDFPSHVAKVVRPNHVQTDVHWTRRWKPCEIVR